MIYNPAWPYLWLEDEQRIVGLDEALQVALFQNEQSNYASQLNTLFGSSLIDLRPLNEVTGTAANDVSPKKHPAGVYNSGVALNAIPTSFPLSVGGRAPSFDGSNCYVDFYSSALNSDLNMANNQAATIGVWYKVLNMVALTDGVGRYLTRVQVDGNNAFEMLKPTGVNNIVRMNYRAGGTVNTINVTIADLNWHLAILTVDKNAGASGEVKGYHDRAQVGATQTGLGTWVGTLANTTVAYGASGNAGTVPWLGYLAYGFILNRAATPKEISQIYYLASQGTPVVSAYWLDAEFATNVSAPISSPRTEEVNSYDSNDPNSKISISAQSIQAVTGTTADTSSVVSHSKPPYLAGLCVKHFGYKEATGGTCFIGWNNAAANSNLGGAFRGTLQPGFYRHAADGVSVALPAGTDSTAREYEFVRNADGGIWVFRDGVLIYVDRSNQTADLWAVGFHISTTTVTPVLDALRVAYMGGVWAQSEGIAVVNVNPFVSATNYPAATADGWHEIKYTLPASPASGDKLELRFRVLGAGDYDTAFITYTGTQWNLELHKFAASVDTQIGATVTNIGTTTNLAVSISGTTCSIWTRNGNTNQGTQRINNAAISNQNSQAGITPVVAQGSWTLANIWSYSLTQMPNGVLYLTDLGF